MGFYFDVNSIIPSKGESGSGGSSDRGKFLALWDCSTGLPETDPTTSPYEYTTGDYYIVNNISDTTNYKPNGSSYTIGVASTTVETRDVTIDDTYYYDGSNWKLLQNTNPVGYEITSNKVTSLSAQSTDTQYPSAKCIYDIVGDIETTLHTINSGS